MVVDGCARYILAGVFAGTTHTPVNPNQVFFAGGAGGNELLAKRLTASGSAPMTWAVTTSGILPTRAHSERVDGHYWGNAFGHRESQFFS